MTPRERWFAVLDRQKPDRIPMDYWATAEVTKKLMQHLGCENEKALFNETGYENGWERSKNEFWM